MSTKTTTTVTTVSGRSSSSGEFDVAGFEKRLRDLKDTQDSIQHLSSWCLSRRAHHKKIVSSWLNVLKQVKIESRLTLFHLANDVIQNSKRKNYEYVDSWGTYLQKATTLVRDEKVKHKILRIFKIWEERDIYNEEFLADLNGLLSVTTPSAKKQQQQQQDQQQQQHQQQQQQQLQQEKEQQHHSASGSSAGGATLASGPTKLAETKSAVSGGSVPLDVEDYQASHLVTIVRECVKHQAETDQSFKGLNKKPHVDVEAVMNSIKGKDRKKVEEMEREIEEQLVQYEHIVEVLKTEQMTRREVLTVLDLAGSFYENQRSEVRVVVNAYRNFGNRLKNMKKKLDELTVSLPSPIPSPDINAPSPVPSDGDNILPSEDGYFQSIQRQGSYLGGGSFSCDVNDFIRCDSPLVMNRVQPIQVIHSRKEQSEGVNDFLKTFFPDPSGYHGAPVNASAGGGGVVAPSQPPPGGIVSHPGPYGGGPGGGVSGGLINPWNTSTPRGPPPGRGHKGGYGGGIRPSYGGPGMVPDYGSPQQPSGRNAGPVVTPLLPPPMPPLNMDGSDEYNSTWDMPMTWDGTHDSSGFQSLDAPVSPSHYDRKSMNSSGMLMDYGDGSSRDDGMLQDVDHRQLSGNLSMPPFAKEKGRLADVDHRNLISLTGSPGGPPTQKDMGRNDLELLDDSSSSGGMSSMGRGAHNRKAIPAPVPAPSRSGNAFSASSDIDLRLLEGRVGNRSSIGSSAALTVVPTTAGVEPGVGENDAGEESKDLDMRIQSLEKAIAAQIASNAVPSLSLEHDAENSPGNATAEDSMNSAEADGDAAVEDGPADGGELSLPSLQTPVSLLEIDDFLQKFERDLTKPPALLMSNQTESSQSPSATSEHSGSATGDGRKNPSDNTESVDMDLSDEDANEFQQRQAHVEHRSPPNSSAPYDHGADESSNDVSMKDELTPKDEHPIEGPPASRPSLNNNGLAGNGGPGGNNIPLHQRPPLLPDPTFPPGGAPKWDLPPPSLLSLPVLGNFSTVLPPPPPPGALVGKLTQPPPGPGPIWTEPPGDVSALFGSPNRPPPPLPFGSGGPKGVGNNYRGVGVNPRGARGHNRANMSPYFRGGAAPSGIRPPPTGLMMGSPFAGPAVGGTVGSPGMRGGYHRGGGAGGGVGGGGANKFRGGGGGGNNRPGW